MHGRYVVGVNDLRAVSTYNHQLLVLVLHLTSVFFSLIPYVCDAQHVCADTLRSAAVLVAAAIATLVPTIPPSVADAVAAVVVSVIIVGSLIPLIQGLIMTAIEIVSLSRNPPPDESESAA